jgi:hypothetical protein
MSTSSIADLTVDIYIDEYTYTVREVRDEGRPEYKLSISAFIVIIIILLFCGLVLHNIVCTYTQK